MRKTVALVMAAVLAFCLCSSAFASGFQGPYITTGVRPYLGRPPELQGGTGITVGDTVLFRVYSDNFEWPDGLSLFLIEYLSNNVPFSPEIIADPVLSLTADAVDPGNHFGEFHLQVDPDSRQLFIAAKARNPGNASLKVAVKGKSYNDWPLVTAAFSNTYAFTIAAGSGSDNGNGSDPGGSDGSGSGDGSDSGSTGGDGSDPGNGAGSGGAAEPPPPKIEGMNPSFDFAGFVASSVGAQLLVSTGDELWIPLTEDMFAWESVPLSHARQAAASPVTLRKLMDAGIRAGVEARGVHCAAALTERSGRAGIRLSFDSISSSAFSLDVYLLCKEGNRITDKAHVQGKVVVPSSDSGGVSGGGSGGSSISGSGISSGSAWPQNSPETLPPGLSTPPNFNDNPGTGGVGYWVSTSTQ